MAFAAAAVILLVLIRRSDDLREDVARIKGVGEVTLGVVRERDGVIREDVYTFAPGDRWKVVVTCPPAAEVWIDVAVDDATSVDYPVAPARVPCGNRVIVPGAFTLTGRGNQICVRVSATAVPLRTDPRPGDPDVACVRVWRE